MCIRDSIRPHRVGSLVSDLASFALGYSGGRKARRRTVACGHQQSDLESSSHMVRADQAVDGGVNGPPAVGISGQSRGFGARYDSDFLEESALCHRSYQPRASCGDGLSYRAEIDPMRQVGGTGLMKNIDWPVIGDRLQTVACLAIPAVINYQASAAIGRNMVGQLGGD